MVLRVGRREHVEDGAGRDGGEGVQVAAAAREEDGRGAGSATHHVSSSWAAATANY